ncbi:MAG: zinc ribbon domain-containing protein [Treponema sp.]|nr:zinc ribbon domain-containing protein [Treponema sp.]
MAFCEDCGAPLTPGAFFCENCGAKLSVPTVNKSPAGIVESGIIYTNLDLLSESINVNSSELSSIIYNFISSAASRGVGYELCDVASRISASGSVQDHIEIIKSLVENKHPKYLFILGSSKVIPSIVWQNEASDQESDVDVSSDLPYSTLDTNSPFDGQEYDFDDCLKVGRLPECDFFNYFSNLEKGCGKIDTIKSFALTADVWKAETKDIYANISDSQPLTSPAVETSTVKACIPQDSNLFLFNLHGSNSTEYWYGQSGSNYPMALDHTSLSEISAPYFLMVEACYGAYYENRTKNDSILLAALNDKCISFLGSSRIAFGTPAPEGCCADIIAAEHLKNLQKGLSAGESLCLARKALMKNSDEESIKTLAEFSLYGDPSARMKGIPLPQKGIFSKDTSKSFTKGIKIPLPDIRRAVRMELTTVDQKIADAIEEMVYSKYEEFTGIKPKYYKSEKDENLTAVFTKKIEIGNKLVNVKFDKKGNVKNIIESK